MKRLILLAMLIYWPNWFSFAQKADTASSSGAIGQYTFILQDSPARLFTMRQFNQDYLSSYRLYARVLNKELHPVYSDLIQGASLILLLGSVTHEEGHRAILIGQNIGSISQPFTLSKKGGYIEGVSDSTLKQMRDNDLPQYIRLHTAGLESDYMLANRQESLMAFEIEPFKNLAVEYIFRKLFIIEYYSQCFVKYNTDGKEETDQLKRDIVGNDVYGAIRHLHRPTMLFQRYTRYSDLTDEEKRYARKMGFRSLLNLLNVNIIGKSNFAITENLRMNLGMAHTMCPFGDYTDENIWLKYQKLKLQAYLREFENMKNWFMAGGLSLVEYPLSKRFYTSASAHLWEQPVNLGFNESKCKFGAAGELLFKYFFISNQKTIFRMVSFDLGAILKTYGFLPEEIEMKSHFGWRLGLSFTLEK
jgi:hypothetical protein